jgi:hypothetical protein
VILKIYIFDRITFENKNCHAAKVYHKRKHWWMQVHPSDFSCDHFDVKKRVASKVVMGTFGKIFKKNCHISKKIVMKLPRLLKNLGRFF